MRSALFYLLLSTLSHAGIVVSTSSSTSSLAYSSDVSTTDLINSGQSTLQLPSQVSASNTSFPGTGINNGGYSNTSADNTFFQVSVTPTHFPATATYFLNTSTNPQGYNITSIRSFMGWYHTNSMAQANQTYTVAIRLVGSTDYNLLTPVSFKPFTDVGGASATAAFESKVNITDSNGYLATGVDSIRFTFSNPVGPDGVLSSTGANKGTVIREIDVIGSPVGATGVVINQPSSRHIVQRSATNTGTIPISGNYYDTADRIEARMVVMAGSANTGTTTAWQTIQINPTGGTYSGTLTNVAAGGWYQLEVRSVTGETPSNVSVVQKVGVGDIYVTCGQSNSANHGGPVYTPTDDRVSTRTSSSASTWRHGYDPQPLATGTGGSAWSRLGDQLVAAEQVPIGFVCVGVGGTQISQWIPGTTYYNTLLKPAVQSFGPSGFRAVLWHQGESDSIAVTSATVYASRLNSMVGQSRTDAGWTVPWYVAEASYIGTVSLVAEEPVTAGQRLAIYGDPNMHLGPTTDAFHLEDAAGGKLIDVVHFNAAGLNDHATQWRNILRGTATPTPRNGDFEDNRNPAITGLAPLADGASHVVTISGDNDSPSVIGWHILSANGLSAADGSNGFHNPTAGTYAGAADISNGGVLPGMSGRHVAMLDGGTAGNQFLHTTRAMVQPDSNHTLTIAIGVRDIDLTFGGARIEILADGVTVASKVFSKADLDTLRGGNSAGTFTDVSLNYQTAATVASNQPLAVKIVKIGGTGTVLDFDNVRLTSVITPYASWQIEHFGSTTAAEAAWGADPDGDSLANSFEYHLGLDPKTRDAPSFLSQAEHDGKSWVRYQVPLDPAVDASTLGLWYSFDLSAWQPAANSPDGTVVEFRQANSWALEISKDDHQRSFFQLRAASQQP
ncbi:MAG: sialate O-acetylesterase [Luteolibacter sp.]